VAKVKEAISAAGHVIVDMADFPATGQPPAQLCAERVRECEVYVAILGTRYGSPVWDRPDVSYTELEFDVAADAGLDRLVFLLDTDAVNVGIPVSKLIDHELGARQEAFRRRVQNSGVATQFFADPASLGQLVERSLQQLAKTRARINSENAPEQVSGIREVPRQLPATVADFIGRVAELQALTRMLDQAGTSTPGTVVISAIGGTAGVGKSALALHWAHQVATRFPDGQLYVNLHGFDPSGNPTAPTEATRGFLEALGVPPERIPASPEAQAGLYRSLLADKRVLILLDNARDEQQVRPLLPASPGILVLVTSRSQLAGLGAAGGAPLISLDVLSHTEAVQLLAARLGPVRAAGQPAAVGRIAALCACLPLALAVAAARAAARPTFPLAALAAELADSARRLDTLDAGDPGSSVRPVFSWSVRQLTSEAARMFRLLGIHPGPDICVPAAASLAGRSEPRAHRLLRELADAHLIAEHVPGRYVFHDLLRAYAAEQACDTDSDTDRREATGRVLDHYLHTAARAARVLDPAKEPVALASLRPGAAAGQPTDLQQALAWFEAEHQVLLAALTLAAGSGFDTHTWQLAWAMKNFLQARGYRQELAAAQRAALAAATRLEDAAAQAVCNRLLGLACIDLGDHDGARAHLASSLALYQRLSNQLGQGKVHQNLGFAAEREGRSTDALAHAEQALRLYRAIGDEANEAAALNGVGWCHGLLGDYQQAQAFCRQALVLSAKTGHRWVEAAAWDSLGVAEHHLGNLAEAAACYQRALSLYPECGERVFEVETLTRLGDTRHAADDLVRAREVWQQALAICEDLQHPYADKVRAKLASTEDHGVANPSA
jgi:tetratricopeptide (TPR) repeat protein